MDSYCCYRNAFDVHDVHTKFGGGFVELRNSGHSVDHTKFADQEITPAIYSVDHTIYASTLYFHPH
jgi:hypothetical protein